jgi:methylthioribose-1-phosphate isomerase
MWKCFQVRGAPAIAIVGSLSVAIELKQHHFNTSQELAEFVVSKFEYLKTSRPTAVNLSEAAERLSALGHQLASKHPNDPETIKSQLIAEIETMLEKDVADNRSIGKHGAECIAKSLKKEHEKARILTHCNTGSLATAGYGTALGVIRALHERGLLDHAYCTETRPYNQGSRLTAYELCHDKIPATLIADSMAAHLMRVKKISAIVVGADRVVANGDTANKIGTYQLSVAAKHHGIPFYVAAPFTTIDMSKATGSDIVIEERPPEELTMIQGVQIAAPGIGCWNPAFDITPSELITGGIVTERGVFRPNELARQIIP